MEFTWNYEKETPQQLKYFLKEQGISKSLLAKIKFQGGQISVNTTVQNVLYHLQKNDRIHIVIPTEKAHETLLLDDTPIDIVYEDDHYLVVNKPSGVASIPAQYHPNGTMANRVKNYLVQQNYPDQVIHIVTRLDRDTTGLMLFAKHGFAHALMDQELRQKKVVKKYQALVAGDTEGLAEHAEINLPIGRDLRSLIKRMITEEGRQAVTEYWLEKKNEQMALVDIQLHTGRTHQIRVHFAAIGCPLLGDDMYEGRMDLGITRQALHCYQLSFWHPFLKKQIELKQALPTDMSAVSGKI